MKRRLAIIGLDCAEPSLIFGPLRSRLPYLAALMKRGRWGRLLSCHPPITVPAWVCLATGLDPGQLGLYGFHNRRGHDYDSLALASREDLADLCLWDLASQARLASAVLGVPLTYPPWPVKGAMVAGWPAPVGGGAIIDSRTLTWPRSLGPLLSRWAGGRYLTDIEEFRYQNSAGLLQQAAAMARRRMAVAHELYRQYHPEVFVMVEMSPDRVQHALWDQEDGPGQAAIASHYELLDGLLGQLLARLEPGTLVLVVSDHGCQARRGNLAINQWLMAQGWLRLKARTRQMAPFDPALVDWPASIAWGGGGYCARIHLNIVDREPQGCLPAEQAVACKQEIKARLEAMSGPDGRLLGNQVLDPEQIYLERRGIAPDLLLYPGGLTWRASGNLLPDAEASCLLTANDTGPDQANHSLQGILIAGLAGSGALQEAGSEVSEASIYDVLPSALKWLGLEDVEHRLGPGRAWRWLC